MNKKGVTIIELLGAIVIFGLALSLVAMILQTIGVATERINLNTKATYEGNAIVRELEKEMQDFSPTDYRACIGTDCIILESHYYYDVDLINETITPVAYDPFLEKSISVENGKIWIDGVERVIPYFTLGALSSIDYTLTLNTLEITISIYLVDEHGKEYQFIANHQFTISEIPVI